MKRVLTKKQVVDLISSEVKMYQSSYRDPNTKAVNDDDARRTIAALKIAIKAIKATKKSKQWKGVMLWK